MSINALYAASFKNTGNKALQRRAFISAIIAMPVLGMAGPAFAHREKLTSTIIEWKNSRQSIEVNHIFNIHHTESALVKLGVIPKPDLQNIKNQARLALYAEGNFGLKSANGDMVELITLGAEADGTNVHVYQEAKLAAVPQSLLVHCAFLRPVIPDQINEIHLDINSDISSMRLSGRQTQKLLIAK